MLVICPDLDSLFNLIEMSTSIFKTAVEQTFSLYVSIPVD